MKNSVDPKRTWKRTHLDFKYLKASGSGIWKRKLVVNEKYGGEQTTGFPIYKV
jgi:hypothetical protein